MTRHRWHAGVERIAECADGNARSVRRCARCGLLRITVHPPHGYPWTEWQALDGQMIYQPRTPACEEVSAAEAA